MSTLTVLVGRRAVLDYARKPLNLALLVLVPVVLVFVWGPTLADFSKLSGGAGDPRRIEAATSGWAAAALAGLAGFFQVTGARSADRRLAAAAHRTAPVVVGRLGASLALALMAACGGLVALAVRVGINDPVRAEAYRTLGLETICRTVLLADALVKATVEGADATNGQGKGFDIVMHESRKYGFARALGREVAAARAILERELRSPGRS